MKTNTSPVLIVVTLLAYWVYLCNASAFYDPGAQRWLNRDPLGEQGFTDLYTLGGTGISPRQFSDLADSKNLYGFCGNDSITSVDLNGNQAQILKILVPRLFPKYPLGGPYNPPSCTLTGSQTTCAPMGPNATICTYLVVLGGRNDETTGHPFPVTYIIAPGQTCPSCPPQYSQPSYPPSRK